MSHRCRIRLLGELSVEQDERSITRFRTQKAGALLAFLAYHSNRSHPREQLLEMLWPDLAPAAGRDNLSFILSSLRCQLEPPGIDAGAVLIADRQTVRINPVAITTDVAAFEAGLSGEEAAPSASERAQRLEDALALYCGPLLPGNFEEWIAPERRRLADLYVHGMRRLIRSLAQAGDRDRAIDLAQRAAAVDPLREAIHCDLMRLYVMDGQVPLALRQYSVLEKLLHQELGAKPSAATRALVGEIRDRERQAAKQIVQAPVDLPETLDEAMATAPTAAERRHYTPTDQAELLAPPIGTVTLMLVEARGTSAAAAHPEGSATAHRVEADPGTLLRQEVKRHGGYPLQRSGRRMGGAFNSARQALACAIAVHRNLSPRHLAEVGTAEMAEEVGRFEVCTALHTDDIAPDARGFHGRVMEQTRRLTQAGHTGQILCSEAAATLLRRDLQSGERLIDLGLFRLRNVPTPEHVFEVEYPGKISQTSPALMAEAGYPARLPVPITRFFGREELLARLSTLLMLEETRLVTLTGAGGMGKTRLSIEAARRLLEAFGGAVWFVPLANVATGSDLSSVLRDGLGLPQSAQTEPLEQVRERLAQQLSLLVLDNFEHLVETEAATVALLLERVATLTCLVTSRQRLGLSGEHEVVVPPLPIPASVGSPEQLRLYESVQLFVDRAQAVKPDFQLTAGNAAAMEELCDRLEGIPLAVELAASRAQMLTPAQMLSQIKNRFAFLVSRKRDVTPRHQTLHAAVDWSYRLLSPELQMFFARLAVFRGGFSLEAAERVCEEELALDALAQLRECSLVLTEDLNEIVRFRMLETLREYAREKLAESGEATRVRDRHLAYFLGLAEEAEPHQQSSLQQVWLDRLEIEHDNLRAALAWSQDASEDAGLRLAGALQRFWLVRGHYREGRETLQRVLERTSAQPITAARAKALNGAGILAWSQGDYAASRALYEESLGIKRELGDRQGVALTLGNLGLIACNQGDYSAARSLYEGALVISRELGDGRGIAAALDKLGAVAHQRAEYASARMLIEESLAIRRELGDRGGIAEALNLLGSVAFEQCDYARASALYEESLAIRRELGDRAGIAASLGNLGGVASEQGEVAAARTLMEESMVVFREIGDRHGLAALLNNLGNLLHNQEDFAGARALHEESLAIRRELGDRQGIAFSLHNLGSLAYDQGSYATARSLFQESIVIYRELKERRGAAYALESLARVLVAQAESQKAVCLWGSAHALRRSIGAQMPPKERQTYDRQLMQVRLDLGEDAFSVAWKEGSAMTWEQAVDHAKGE